MVIPPFIKPSKRDWRIGEVVVFTTEKNSWNIGIVFSNGKPRFCKGWNKFVREHEVEKNQLLTFNMIDGGQITFQVHSEETT